MKPGFLVICGRLRVAAIAMLVGSALALVLFAGGASAQQEGDGPLLPIKPSPRSPELDAGLKVLDRFVGTWKIEWTNKKAEWTPKEVRVAGTYTSEWVLDGRYHQSKGRNEDGSTNFRMATYDPENKEYRLWYFDARGAFSQARGHWDEKAKTLTWEGKTKEGIPTVLKARFVDRNTVESEMIIKDKEGKVYIDSHGKASREEK